MHIVLVNINNFQEYILDNIKQLIFLNYKSIYIITNKEFFDKYDIIKSDIKLIDKKELENDFTNKYENEGKLSKDFRNGFFHLASMRFHYIYSLMNKYDLKNILHIENDVVLYYNWFSCFDKIEIKKLCIPFDSLTRNIASIIYIPDKKCFFDILDKYDYEVNDMYNFYKSISTIINLPICKKNNYDNEEKFVCKNYDMFKFIFDAAAIGQYLDGIDPQNSEQQTVGFVNETCVIDYSNFKILWINEKPYIDIDNEYIPIFNLHIHSKRVYKYTNVL